MVAMKHGDRVKYKGGRKGTITGSGRRPSPADDHDLNTRVTHWGVTWDDTGTEDAIPMDDLTLLTKFSEADLATLKRDYPSGHYDGDDEFTAKGVSFVVQTNRRVHVTLDREMEINEFGDFQDLDSALVALKNHLQRRSSH